MSGECLLRAGGGGEGERRRGEGAARRSGRDGHVARQRPDGEAAGVDLCRGKTRERAR